MNVRKEINRYASEDDKPILNWLLDHYSWASKWEFVADCTFKRHGTQSYQTHRVWTPTKEGRILYEALNEHPSQSVAEIEAQHR